MKTRKIYEAPAMEVVELQLQGSLLAGSTQSYDSDFNDSATLDGFDDFN